MSKWFYCLNLKEAAQIQVGLHQVDEKIKGVEQRRKYLDTGFTILKRTQEGTQIAGQQDFLYGRDCEFEQNLKAGQYVILP